MGPLKRLPWLRRGNEPLGRKRFLIVDTLGLILSAVVVGAGRQGGEDVLIETNGLYHRFKKLWADGGYSGENFAQAAKRLGCEVEAVKRNDNVKGFEVLPKRWIVARTHVRLVGPIPEAK